MSRNKHKPNRAERRAQMRADNRLTANDEYFVELRKMMSGMDPEEQKQWEAEVRHILQVEHDLRKEVQIGEQELRFCVFAESIEELNQTVNWIGQQTPRLEDGQPFYMSGVDLISAKGSLVPGSLIDYNGTKVFYYDATEFKQVQFHQIKMKHPLQLEERAQMAAAEIQRRKAQIGAMLEQRMQQIEFEKEMKQRKNRPAFGLQTSKR
jgi:hypothetical protein